MAVGIVLNYQKDVYDGKIEVLETYANNLDGYIDDLERLQNELLQYWDDDQARSFYDLVSDELVSVRTALMNVRNLKTEYSEIVTDMTTKSNTVQNTVDTARLAISAMGIAAGA